MVDAQGIVAVCNARAIGLLELPQAQMAERPLLRDLAAAEAGGGIFALMEQNLRPLPADESVPAAAAAPLSGEHHLASGSIVDLRCVTLAHGGFVPPSTT